MLVVVGSSNGRRILADGTVWWSVALCDPSSMTSGRPAVTGAPARMYDCFFFFYILAVLVCVVFIQGLLVSVVVFSFFLTHSLDRVRLTNTSTGRVSSNTLPSVCDADSVHTNTHRNTDTDFTTF